MRKGRKDCAKGAKGIDPGQEKQIFESCQLEAVQLSALKMFGIH
jgi:hypothetical protein